MKFYQKITNFDWDFLDEKKYSENDLLEIARLILQEEDSRKIIFLLLQNLSKYGKDYDWNLGSIFQHFPPKKVIAEFKRFGFDCCLNSIGLTWVFGEYKIQSKTVIDYLSCVIENSKDDAAWWRAAFSLGNITNTNAITLLKNSLKRRGIGKLDYYLANLGKESSIVGILLHSNSGSIKDKIYPTVKKVFLEENDDTRKIINCIWIIGRLNLIDKDIYIKMKEIIEQNKDYELIYYTFFAIQENIIDVFEDLLRKNISNSDPLIRKMVIRGLSNISNNDNLRILEEALMIEKDDNVIHELTKDIYKLKNPLNKKNFFIKRKYIENENGLIIDESDKWYGDPAIYNIFSESEDPENLCFKLVVKKLKENKVVVKHPVDLACGTGRSMRQILNSLSFEGKLYAVDVNPKMIEFLEKSINRRRDYIKDISIIQSSIEGFSINSKSTFIISSFGFPSKTFDQKRSLKELKNIYSAMDDKGIFVTIGWDETFNDELNYFWYKYLPDDICAKDFEEWRIKRTKKIKSPRNCNLTWFKKGLTVPLQFSSIEESAHVMGHLFGRDALEDIVKNKKTEWMMSLGITYNTKEEIGEIIKKYERG